MGKSSVKETPLMKQYNAIKAKHPGALLLFRVGDFYETFGEDAVDASKILDIVLTKRSNGSASEVALAGFPHHSLDNYLPKLVRAGKRVAICDQLEDPRAAKGIVKRGVTELVTPGLALSDHVLEQKKNNYLASLAIDKERYGLSLLDLSTGEFLVTEGNFQSIDKLIQSLKPSELIFDKANRSIIHQQFAGADFTTYALEDWVFTEEFGQEKLTRHFRTTNLKGFGVENLRLGISASGAILHYLEETEHKHLDHVTSISRIDEDQYVWLDQFTIRNLELVSPQQDDGVPLISIMDQTLTPMGSRLMRRWVVLPLKDLQAIQQRHQAVEALLKDADLCDALTAQLNEISDLERLISKVAVNRINPREMQQLKKSLICLEPIAELLKKHTSVALNALGEKLETCDELIQLIDGTLQEDPPLLVHQGGLINDGVNPELDELRSIAFSGKDHLLKIQQEETERTGITSLKIAYNKVFGYYLEVTHAHKDKVPPEWIRKQTLVNAERYITPELKEYEEKILNAEVRIQEIESRLYQELVSGAAAFVTPVQRNARVIATLDCLLSFAVTALRQKYVIPEMNEGLSIDIREGRHPVIERQLPLGEDYIPNDVMLDTENQQVLIITGPNMAGKSALLRQTALIVLMAQMGSFVPAKSASLGIVDKVFTRVGASDNLSQGESTFMVEMTETASILNNLSERSLLLMDEIGRGTSTYDGISIAWSIVEFLHDHPKFKPKTLFATHYHELNELATNHERIRNYNVSVKEVGNKIIFLRKLQEGGSEHSFGIHVAQLAGMPNPVVFRANDILHRLEKDKINEPVRKNLQEMPVTQHQLNLFAADPKFEAIMEILENLDINTISPVEALLKLNEMKSKLS